MEMTRIPARAEVPDSGKWAVRDLFASDADWRAAYNAAKAFVPRVAAYRGRLSESGRRCAPFLLDDEISLAFDALVHYAQRAAATRIPASPRIRRW